MISLDSLTIRVYRHTAPDLFPNEWRSCADRIKPKLRHAINDQVCLIHWTNFRVILKQEIEHGSH